MVCCKWYISINGYCHYGDDEDAYKEKLLFVETNQTKRIYTVKLKLYCVKFLRCEFTCFKIFSFFHSTFKSHSIMFLTNESLLWVFFFCCGFEIDQQRPKQFVRRVLHMVSCQHIVLPLEAGWRQALTGHCADAMRSQIPISTYTQFRHKIFTSFTQVNDQLPKTVFLFKNGHPFSIEI